MIFGQLHRSAAHLSKGAFNQLPLFISHRSIVRIDDLQNINNLLGRIVHQRQSIHDLTGQMPDRQVDSDRVAVHIKSDILVLQASQLGLHVGKIGAGHHHRAVQQLVLLISRGAGNRVHHTQDVQAALNGVSHVGQNIHDLVGQMVNGQIKSDSISVHIKTDVLQLSAYQLGLYVG